MLETRVCSLGWEDPLEQGMVTHSSLLAWRIPKDRGAWQAAVHEAAKSQAGPRAHASDGAREQEKWDRVCVLYCFVLSPLISLGAVPHHHLALSVKVLTYTSNS